MYQNLIFHLCLVDDGVYGFFHYLANLANSLEVATTDCLNLSMKYIGRKWHSHLIAKYVLVTEAKSILQIMDGPRKQSWGSCQRFFLVNYVFEP